MTDIIESFTSAFRAAHDADGALKRTREAAFDRFTARGIPTRRDERWKYTSLDALARQSFTPANAGATVPDWASVAPALSDCDVVTFVNGHLAGELPAVPDGVKLVALRDLGDDERAVAERVATADDGVLPAFTALNTALFADGVLLELPEGATLGRPLVLRFLNDATENLAQHPRVIVAAGKGATATLAELYEGRGQASSFCNAVSQFELAEGASINHLKVHLEADKAQHIGAIRAHVAANALFHQLSLALAGKLTRNDIEIFLDGEGADVALHGLLLGSGRQHMDYHTLVEHRSPNATSEEIYKAVLDDRSRGVFDGAVRVHKGADGTDAAQRSNNLLLSNNAEIDTKPMLEIYADDVKCAHGATVGQLDEDALFYLEARGIAAEDARAMLTAGFAQEITDLVPDDGLAIFARSLVDEHLGVTSDVS